MVKKSLEWIEQDVGKVNISVIHIESLEDVEAAINHIKSRERKVYLSLKFTTKIDVVLPYLRMIKFSSNIFNKYICDLIYLLN